MTDGFKVLYIDEFDEQAEEFCGVDFGSSDIRRLCRHAMDKGVEGLLGDGSGCNQAVAQSSAKLRLKVERVRHLFQGDQTGLDQQIAQSQTFFDDVLPLGLS